MRSARDAGTDEAPIPRDKDETMTTIKLTGGDLGREVVFVRAILTNAASNVMVDYCEGAGWEATQYQVAETRHRTSGLAKVGKWLAAKAVGCDTDEFECDWEEID
jgi:hypothetical protein